MSKPTLLLYDPIGSPWAGKLKQLCAVQGLRLRPVENADLSRPVGVLAAGSAPAETAQAVPLPEPVLVFCNLSGAQLDRLLASLRRLEVPRSVLKAVLTPHNALWTFSALYEELRKERLSMAGELRSPGRPFGEAE